MFGDLVKKKSKIFLVGGILGTEDRTPDRVSSVNCLAIKDSLSYVLGSDKGEETPSLFIINK